MMMLCEFVPAGLGRQVCTHCAREADVGAGVRSHRACVAPTAAVPAGNPCQHLGAEIGLRECTPCRGRTRLKTFDCRAGHGQVTRNDCRTCGDYSPVARQSASKKRVLLRLDFGLGDAVQLTVVLRHLKELHPDWAISVSASAARATGIVEAGLACDVVPLNWPPLPHGYDEVRDLAWHEPDAFYADSPSTKAEKCLREAFQIAPRSEWSRYQLGISDECRDRVREFVGPVPYVLVHYQGRCAKRAKNIDENAIRFVGGFVARRGWRMLVLDFDRQSTLDFSRNASWARITRDAGLGMYGGADAMTIAALAESARVCIGIDSGPGKCFAATNTPTIICWRHLHPLQYHCPAPNCLHLVPHTHHRQLGAAAAYFAAHYTYRELRENICDALPAAVAECCAGLVTLAGMAYQPDRSRSVRYDDAYFRRYERLRGTPIARVLNRSRVGLVNRHAGRVPLLDVGIGTGEFLDTWDHPAARGFDVNPVAERWLRERGRWDDPATGAVDRAQAVTLWDVLEHLPEPDELLSRLRIGQWVFCSLPIFEDLAELPRSKHFRPNEHFRYWTHAGLVAWMRVRGLFLVEFNDDETAAGRQAIRSYAFRRLSGARKILITGGLGDFLALESRWSADFRASLEAFYYATRAEPLIRQVVAALQLAGEFPHLVHQQTLWNNFSHFRCFHSAEEVAGHCRLPDELDDWSIGQRFPSAAPFVGSTALRHVLADVSRFALPTGYVVLAPYSGNVDAAPRDFTAADWDWGLAFLARRRLTGVVLQVAGPGVPRNGRLVDLSDRTTILESIEIVKGAAAFVGCASSLSVIAAQAVPSLVKGSNPHLLRHVGDYYPAHDHWRFLVPQLSGATDADFSPRVGGGGGR